MDGELVRLTLLVAMEGATLTADVQFDDGLPKLHSDESGQGAELPDAPLFVERRCAEKNEAIDRRVIVAQTYLALAPAETEETFVQFLRPVVFP